MDNNDGGGCFAYMKDGAPELVPVKIERIRGTVALSKRIRARKRRDKLLDNLPSGAALYEYDNRSIRAVHINKRYWELVGREPGDYTKKSIFDTIHPDDHEMIRQELRCAIRQNRNVELDLRVLGGDGEYKPFHVTATVTPERAGKYALYACFTRITDETMSIQRMLPIALSTMMSSSSDYSYVMDKDFHYVCCSRSVAELAGLESERDILGKTDYDLFGAELAQSYARNNARIMETGEPMVGRIEEIPKKSGGAVFVSSSVYPIVDASGNNIGLYRISHDVTKERKLTFELDALLNTIPSGVLKYAADEGERFEYINRNFVESLGYTRESFREKFNDRFCDMVWREDREWVAGEVIRQEGAGGVGKFDYRVEAADGQLRWIHDEGVKITDQDGKSWYYVTLFDITRQQETLEKLRVSEEVNRLAMEHSGKIITRFDVKARTLTLPDSLTPIFALPQVLQNLPLEQIRLGRVSPQTARVYSEMFEDIIEGKAFGKAVFQQKSTLGWRWLEANYTTAFSNTKRPISAVIIFEDITQRLEKEVVYSKWQQSLTNRPRDSYTLFRCNLSKNSSFDSCEGSLLDISFAENERDFSEMTRNYVKRVYKEDRDRYMAFVNSDAMLAGYYRGHRADSLEYRETNADGSARWLRLSVELVEYPKSKDVEVFLMYEDINSAKLEEIRTREKAENDPLTGVLNRDSFISRMDAIIRGSMPGDRHALFILDIDDFKRVNDTYGHLAGDEALKELTRKMLGCLRRDDLVGRLGGDEFLVFLKDIPDSAAAAAKAKQICGARIAVAGGAQVTVSVGIALIPEDGDSFGALYKKVDGAMYDKKANGKNGFVFADGPD